MSNLPWASSENEIRFDERSLSLAVLYDLVPTDQQGRMTEILNKRPKNMGRSFATNAVWRYWALAKNGETPTLVNEFSDDWYGMPSVIENNTMGEFFDLKHDDTSQWSHASVAPLICFYKNILGLRPLEPGMKKVEIRPNLGTLKYIKGQASTPLGPIIFDLKKSEDRLSGEIQFPQKMTAIFIDAEGTPSEHQMKIRL